MRSDNRLPDGMATTELLSTVCDSARRSPLPYILPTPLQRAAPLLAKPHKPDDMSGMHNVYAWLSD